MRLAEPYEPFVVVERRLNIAARLITAQEWLDDGSDPYEVRGLLHDLEREVLRAIWENQAAPENVDLGLAA
jgi:hypothetical protein